LSLGVPKENILDLGNVGTCHHLPIEKAGRCRAMFTFMPIPIAHCRRGWLSWYQSFAAEPAFLRLGWMWFRVPKVSIQHHRQTAGRRYGPGCL